MSFRRCSVLAATAVFTGTALARAEDLPAKSQAAPSVAAPASADAAPPQPEPPSNATGRVQPAAQPEMPVESLTWSDPRPRPRRGAVSRWYGGQTLLVDGTSVVLFIAGASMQGEGGSALAALGLMGYGIGGPIVHLAHENGWRALGSLALRGGLPLTFGFIGAKAENCDGGGDDFFCGLAGALLGGLVGIGTAMAVDAAVLAREDVPAPESKGPRVGFFSDGRRTLVTAGGYF